MNGLFRFIAKLFGRDRSGAADVSPSPAPPSHQSRGSEVLEPAALGPGTPASQTLRPAQIPTPSSPSPEPPDAAVVFLELTEEEDVLDEPEDESDEADPTLGRYEELQVPTLDAKEIGDQRAAAEAQGLAGPHKIYPHDPAGPGSLAETLARLEAEGRVTSRVCDDDEAGFYVLYQPATPA